ncbi:MAG: AMIN domain-containing protein, partial [Synechococcales bacterium]|nr:AMIN domain-containing protein [Synechococcales bacterium]
MNAHITPKRLIHRWIHTRSRSGASAIAALVLRLSMGYLYRLSLSGGAAIGLGLLLVLPVQAAPMDGWKYDPQTNSLEFVITDGVTPRSFLMAQPARIVIDLPNTQMGQDIPADQAYDTGAIRQITVTQLQPQLTRIVLHMSPDAVFARGQVALERLGDGDRSFSDRWVVRPLLAPGKSSSQKTTPTPQPTATLPSQLPVTNSRPAAKPTLPSSVATTPRFNRTTELATPPKAAEYPPGMASVAISMQQPVKSPLGQIAIAPQPRELQPSEVKSLEAKPLEVKPLAPKPIDNQAIGVSTSKPVTTEPSVAVPVLKEPVAKAPIAKDPAKEPIAKPETPIAPPLTPSPPPLTPQPTLLTALPPGVTDDLPPAST